MAGSKQTQRGPTFIGIGAQKAGTSWLASTLSRHPEIFVPPPARRHITSTGIRRIRLPAIASPPPCFPGCWGVRAASEWRDLLREHFRSGRRKQILSRWWRRFYFRRYDDDWYRSLFDEPQSIRGEVTPAYSLLSDEHIRWVREVAGDVHIVLLLRNPVERDWSQFRFMCHRKRIDPAQMTEAAILEYLGRPEVTDRSDYLTMLRRWRGVFGDRVGVFRYELIRDQPEKLLLDVMQFIGVPESAEVDPATLLLSRRVNESPSLPMPASVRDVLTQRHAHMLELLSRWQPGEPPPF